MWLDCRFGLGLGTLLILLTVCHYQVLAVDNEILGCGGFIKSQNSEIDFSKIEVKLFTKSGALKDKTDCSPSNGYYFIPLYDQGDYILRLSHPPGWSFEQTEIAINFDGESDMCSQGKDVNFAFRGFGITGRVGIVGQQGGGAPDVHVELREKGKAAVVGSVKTDRYGVFSFSPIVPGTYVIRVSHDRWHFGTEETEVVVKTGNTEIKEGVLVVSGFDVVGKVTSDRQPFGNVGLAAFPMMGSPTVEPKCKLMHTTTGVTHSNAKYNNKAICSTTSTASDGGFIFRGLAPGKYLIKAFFDNPALKFNIEPKEMEVEVVRDTTKMSGNFEVTGFDVSGRVLTSAGGPGVPHAKVKLNGGAHVITTNAEGAYVLENIKAGTYTLQVTAENVQFIDHTVKITGTNPHIPDILVSAFKVCGTVVSVKSQKVAITKHASTFHAEATSASDGTGEWCAYLPNGRFSLEVLTSAEEKQKGVQFFPLKHDIEVNSRHLSGITFSQLKAKVAGKVQCASDAGGLCQGLRVALNGQDGTGRTETATVVNGEYQFENILPGKYEAVVSSPLLCWEQTKLPVDVKSASESIPAFRQNGYKMTVISSHATRMDYSLANSNNNAAAAAAAPGEEKRVTATQMELLSGLNDFCVRSAGSYDVKFLGCHSVDANKAQLKTIKTGSESPFTVTFNRHRNGFKIVADQNEPFQVQIEQGGQKRVLDRKSLEPLAANMFRHVLDLGDGEAITITPVSETLLFKPSSYELVGGNDCVEDRFTFKARKGLILNGRVEPAIKDVRIRLKLTATGEELHQTTSERGTFKFGPIDTDSDYEVFAEKESYVFGSFDKSRGLFEAHKLCEIVVTVKDEAGHLLSGVLISLSGGESYRKNLISGADGMIHFHSLSPSQYFLKPMLKEYKFESNSKMKMVQIADGETVNVDMVGKRVAYSVFGTVTSLNGDPFPNVVLEAISEKCSYHQEEASSEHNGGYRIRGLQPGCEYSIRAKKMSEGGQQANVDRTIPLERIVNVETKDVENVNIIAISPIGFVDVTVRVMASSNEHYKTLRVLLYRKGDNDNPIYNGRLETPLNVKSKTNPGVMVFFPRIPYDGKTYFIELSTTLSKSNHKYEIPSFQFQANRSSVFHEFEFTPEVRAAEPELNQNSIAALVLLCIVAFAFLKQELFLELCSIAFNKISTVVQDLIEKNRQRDARPQAAALNDRDLDSLAKSINDVRKKKPKKVQ